MLRTTLGIFLLVSCASSALAQTQKLSGSVSQYSAYLLEDERLRHNRYELNARQEVDFDPTFKTVIAGRLWWDPVMMDNEYAVHHDYPESVRDDELYDGQMREVYVDYFGEFVRVRIGRQIIDWTDTFAPALVNMVTAVDVRHGITGNPTDYIIPVDALRVNHGFLFDGTLEWLAVPRGVHHRLPEDENGYGYVERLAEEVEPRGLVLREEEIPDDQDEMEGGVKYQATFGQVDYNVFAYRGHQRDPAFRVEGGLSTVTITQYYPRVDTYGTSLTWAGEALVLRGLGFYEPKRKPRDREVFSYPEGSVGDDVYDRRIQIGLGIDYTFNEHLSVFSRHYGIRYDTVIPEDSTREEKNLEGYEDSYRGVIRLANETVDDLTLQVDGVWTTPNKSYLVEPSAHYEFYERYRIGAGYRHIHADHSDTVLAAFENSDLVFIRLTSLIGVDDILQTP